MRKCVICGGDSSPFTVGEDEEGKRALVHADPCAAVLSERRQKAAQEEAEAAGKAGKKRPKTAGTSMWTVEWEPGRFGYQHKLPCACPKHKDLVEITDADVYYQ